MPPTWLLFAVHPQNATAVNAPSTAVDLASTAATAVSDAASTATDAASSTAQSALSAVSSAAHSVLSTVSDAARSAAVAVAAWASGALASAGHIAGQLVMDIFAQMIGTGIIAGVIYRYRDNLKETIEAIVTKAAAVVPGDLIDVDEVVDFFEEAAGIDTESDEEAARITDGEETPLLATQLANDTDSDSIEGKNGAIKSSKVKGKTVSSPSRRSSSLRKSSFSARSVSPRMATAALRVGQR